MEEEKAKEEAETKKYEEADHIVESAETLEKTKNKEE